MGKGLCPRYPMTRGVSPDNTRRYLDVDSTFFERYGRQSRVVCILDIFITSQIVI